MLKFLLNGLVLAAGMVAVAYAGDSVLAARISGEQGVKVTVTPVDVSAKADVWDFDVVLETHVRELDSDMAKSSVLIADGKEYAPLAWDGAPPGGHHRKGHLRFRPIKPAPESVEVQIRLTGEAAPRSFRWILKGAGDGN